MKLYFQNNFKKVFKFAALNLLAFAFYFIAAKLGLQLTTFNPQSSPIWPASGIALGFIYLYGYEVTVGIFLAALLANFQTGLDLAPSLLLGFGNLSEAVVGCLIFNYLIKNKSVYGVHSKVIFSIFALIIAATFSASVGTLALFLFAALPDSLFIKNWSTWWLGDMVGALYTTPFFYKYSIGLFKPIKSLEKNYLRFVGLMGATALCNYIVFLSSYGSSFLFIVFVPLLLSILWFDSLWIYFVSLATCICALLTTTHGIGPFALYVFDNNYIHLQLFLLALGVTALGLGSLRQDGLHQKAMVALVFGWLISGLAFYSVYNSNKKSDQNKFTLQAQQAQEAVHSKLNEYIAMLDGGVGFFNASDKVTKKEWKSFTDKIISNRNNSNVEGLGVIFAKPQVKSAEFHTVPYVNIANGKFKPEAHFIVSFIEPLTEKKGIIGLDMSTEKNRYEAAVKARDSGQATLTNTIHLGTGDSQTNALILFNPFYKQGARLDTIKLRQAAFLGLVYAPIVVDKFLQSALYHSANEIHLSFQFDGDTVLTKPSFVSSETPVDVDNKIVRRANFAGQPVTLTWRKTRSFEFSSDFVFSMVSFFGAMVSLLLAMMLSSLQSITLIAQKIADHKTKEVIEKNTVWKSLTENSPNGIFLADRQGQLTYINPAFSQMTGMSLDKVRSQGWTFPIHPDDHLMVYKLWRDLLSGKNKFEYDFRFLLEGGQVTFNSVRAIPLVNEKNQTTGFLGITQDISDLVKKNNALVASSRLSSLGEMAGGIAHEINNPLSIIMGKAALISQMADLNATDPVKIKKFISQINETCQRIAKIIRGLRSFARDTSSEPFQRCSVEEVIEDTLELCHERFTNHSVVLKLPQSVDHDLYFWGRSEQLAQVLLNLLNNAFDAARESTGRWVEVKIVINEKIRIVVIDSGHGIEPSNRQKIFEPFYTSKTIGQGTGLGLSISRGIMQTHHGDLFLDINELHTTFVIEINRFLDQSATQIEFIG